MRAGLRIAILAGGLAALAPSTAAAQFEFLNVGVYGARATESFDGSSGLGGFVSWSLPVLPVTLRAQAERYFPDCGTAEGCSTWAWGGDALLRLPLPLVSPYAVAGWTQRRVKPGEDLAQARYEGVALGVGADAGLPGLRVFGEVRREMLDPRDQWILRLGLFLY